MCKFSPLLSFLFFFSLSLNVLAQEIPLHMTPELEQRLDQHFAAWANQPNHPGVAAGVIQDGKIIYLKGFGTADLEQQISITPDTKFNIGNLSRQFLAFSILLMEEQGQLALSDDVRKYLPELPDFGHTITIRNLLSQSSGLHEFWGLRYLSGWGGTDVFTLNDIVKLIGRQKELDYVPGTRFSSTNTGLALLPLIIEKISGQSFSEWTQQHIFQPLQMTNTLFVDDHEQIIEGVAKSYQATANGHKKSVINQNLPGLSNLYTSVTDLCKWYLNFDSPKVGSPALIRKLDSSVTINDGSTLYPNLGALSYGQQYKHPERGLPIYWNYSMIGGYSSNVFRYLDQNLTSFVIGNNNQYNGMPAMGICYDLLADVFTKAEVADLTGGKEIKMHRPTAERFSGHYWDDHGSSGRRLYVENDTLHYQGLSGRISKLIPISETKYQMLTRGDDEIVISLREENGKKQVIVNFGESDPMVSDEYTPAQYTAEALNTFAGSYYCEAYNTGYTFSVKDGQLVASHLRNDSVTFIPIANDVFYSNSWYFKSIRFLRDAQQNITGFSINYDGIRNLEFVKLR
ncbi:MAG: serine hydrolase domain-containing protein [Bacteroidota bacterium]